jgi:hypothetical protein
MDVRHDERLWVRKVDGDMHVMPPEKQPRERWYPGTLDELLWCVKRVRDEMGPVAELRTTGSHWAMSEASVTLGDMLETATPVHEADGNQAAPRLNHVLYDVIPSCLTPEARRFFFYAQPVPVFDPNVPINPTAVYLFHVEAGIRLHELYSYIDADVERGEPRSMASEVASEIVGTAGTPPARSYFGPWALETMGGAGGQTIAGVASTATHGGDVAAGAIGELVVAMHLISPDGQEYWIERTSLSPTIALSLTDPLKLANVYTKGAGKPGGTERETPIIHKRSDDLMNAAIVSCGRMGVVYSVVLRTIRQYALVESCRVEEWREVRKWLCSPAHPTFASTFANRFVRVDVDVYPKPELDWGEVALMFALGVFTGPVGFATGLLLGLSGNSYRSWIITRNTLPLQAAEKTNDAGQKYFYGRPERAGANAGKGRVLGKEDDRGYFSNPCGTGNVIRDELTRAIGDLSDVRDEALVDWALAEAALLIPLLAPAALIAQAVAIAVILFSTFWITILSGIRAALPDELKFGDIAASVLNMLASIGAHSLVQLLYWAASSGEHPDPAQPPQPAISYAVMDQHDYQNIGCVAPGDSIEFFIDANSAKLIEFIDAALAAVRDLANAGLAFGGYISMRFMTTSPAFLATQRWARTCSIEIAGLSRASGTETLISRLEEESRNYDIALHWGQRNHRNIDDVEKHFSPTVGGALFEWRDALSQLSEHGRLANFSTDYTRHKGLEITQPRLYALGVLPSEGCALESTSVSWDAFKNPPGTALTLVQVFEDGRQIVRALPSLAGSMSIPIGTGRSTLELHAVRTLQARQYSTAPLTAALRGFASGDVWEFQFEATQRPISGVVRWFVEINLYSQFISNSLRVAGITVASTSAAAAGPWILRNPEIGDVTLPSLPSTRAVPTLPVFNKNWQLFSIAAAGLGAAPLVHLRFQISC